MMISRIRILIHVGMMAGSVLLGPSSMGQASPLGLPGSRLASSHERAQSKTDPTDSIPIRILPEGSASPKLHPQTLQKLESFWIDMVRDYQLPGVVIGIIQDDGRIYELCIGNRSVQKVSPIDSDTVFHAGEVTLAFTTLLGATADRPDSPVFDRRASTVTPLFRLTDQRAQSSCRVRDLLTMSSGIPSYTDDILDPQWARPEDVFALLGQAPVMSPPGQHYRPSQISGAVGGYLIAMALGNNRRNIFANYVDVAQRQLIEPLTMTRATFTQPADDNFATGHTPAGFGYNPVAAEKVDQHPLVPLLGLQLSLNDATKWVQAELSLGLAPSGERVASRISLLERWQPATVRASQHVGMGWRRIYHDETEVILSQGEHQHQTMVVGLYPSFRTGVVVMVNAEGDDAQRLVNAVTLGVAELLKDSLQASFPPAMARESVRTETNQGKK